MDEISIIIGDNRYTGWKAFNLHNTLDAVCGSFSMTLVAEASDITEEIKIGARVDIFIGQTQMMAGYIFTREQSHLVYFQIFKLRIIHIRHFQYSRAKQLMQLLKDYVDFAATYATLINLVI